MGLFRAARKTFLLLGYRYLTRQRRVGNNIKSAYHKGTLLLISGYFGEKTILTHTKRYRT